MTAIRCSSLPLVAKCAQAIWPNNRPGNEQAREGTAVHELMAYWLSPESGHGYESVEAVCTDMKLDPTAVGILYAMTRHAWSEVEQWFPAPRECERYFESTFGDLLLTGHLDVLTFAEADTEARVCDYKTGWLDEDCEDQQRGYGWLVCQHYPLVRTVRSCALRPRQQVAEWNVWTREELEEWMKDFAKHVWKKEYQPSPGTCRWCPRLINERPCEQGQASMRAATALIVDANADDYAVTFDNPVRAVQTARIVKKLCEAVEDWARAACESAGGRLEGDGHELVLTPTDKETISFAASEPILRNLLGTDLPNVVQIGKGRLEDALRSRAGKGKGAKLIREVFEQLDAVGAIEVTTSYRLEVKRAPKLIERGAN